MGVKALSKLSTSKNFSISSGVTPTYVPYVNVWMIAGGGGGGGYGGYSGAGGGAGGLVSSVFPIMTGYTYNVTVGAGGNVNAKGSDSSFVINGTANLMPTLIAYGGGVGAAWGFQGTSGGAGGCGGGGGSTGASGGSTYGGGAGVLNQGNDGGDGSTYYNSARSGAGGGGQGAAGQSNSAVSGNLGGAGGIGTTAYTALLAVVGEGVVSGSYRYIGAGGTGGNSIGNYYTSGVAGSLGGGGSGAGTGGSSPNAGGSATAFTGSGGGGGNGVSGGQGASGFVVVYYSTKYSQAATTGSPTYYTDGTYHYYKFKTSGTISF